MSDEVLLEQQGHISIVTLNRPDARNAINVALMQRLSAILDRCETDENCRVIVLTGAGDKAFSAGMDLKAFAQGERPFNEYGFGGMTLRNFAKPLVGAANGSAFAGGFEMLLMCDIIVAAEHAKFGIPETQIGLFAGAGGLLRLPNRLSPAIASEMALTAEPITAERAFQLGLVNHVLPGDTVQERALAIAERIAGNAPLAVRASKRVLREVIERGVQATWPLNDELFAKVADSNDAHEGATAFAEKRAPQWRGN
jgi:enoyl-CoA hydratase